MSQNVDNLRTLKSYRLIILHYKHTKKIKYGYIINSPLLRMFQIRDPHYHTKSSKYEPPELLGQWFCLQSHYMIMWP
jgi:hypothetical protein